MQSSGDILSRQTWLLACLHWLAERAWAYEPDLPRSQFVLAPDALPLPDSQDKCEECLSILFSHARAWTPGLSVPVERPVVLPGLPSNRIPYARTAPGSYHVGDREFIHVRVDPEYLSCPQACLSVLCHEGSHYILDISCLALEYSLPPDPDGGSTLEQATDLAMFISGFGEVFLQGYRASGLGKLGYLSDLEYELAQKWVLSGRGIEDPGVLQQFLRRNYGILRYPKIPLIPEYRDWVCRNLLELLHGDKLAAQSLVGFERRRSPCLDDTGAAQAAIRRLLKDRAR
jgi:hypothetical protein